MKPVKLTVSAFGPFAGIEIIDFAKFGDSGVYLIAGEMGAGKTTVFDAVSFALFGKASGQFRDVRMLRSDHAVNGAKTFAELDFVCANLIYNIKREIKFDKSGSYRTTDASLTLPDGNIITGSACDDKIVEILGINKNMFAQIVMIAQNDFLRFLQSKTPERVEILRRIFGTERLRLFQDGLKERMRKMSGEYEAIRKNLEMQGLEIYRRGEQFAEWEREAETCEREISELDGKILNLEKIRPLADDFARAEQELKDSQNSVSEAGINLKKSREDFEGAQKTLETLPALSVHQEEFANLRAEWEQVSQRLKVIEKLEFNRNMFAVKERELIKARETFESLQGEFAKYDGYHKNLAELFWRNQAGVLARELKDGEECPVCGSAIHPKPARINQEDSAREDLHKNLSESSVKNAQADAENARLRRDEKAKECAALNTQVNMLNERFEQDLQEAEINSDANIPELIAQTRESAENLRVKKDERGKYIEKLTHDLELLTELARKAETAHQSALTLIKEREAREAAQFDLLVAARNAYLEILQACGFERYTAQEVSPEINGLREKRGQISARRSALLNKLENLTRHVKFFEETEQQFAAVKQLSDAANGRLDFETYAQRVYFERVLRAANHRLKIMSQGRYALLRRSDESGDGRIKTGLELEILDAYTGKKRGANSLSGGESFLASLSLALGLSDVVQQSAGNVRLEAMFIDEGFGSLDSDTLELAVRTLANIAENGRIIGIISHVSEIRERIGADRQIFIRKTSAGSYIN